MGDSQVIIGGGSPLDSWPTMSSPPRGTPQEGPSGATPQQRQAAERRAARRAEGSSPNYNDDQTRVDLPALTTDEERVSPRAAQAAPPDWPLHAAQPPAAPQFAPPAPPAPLSHAPWTVASSWGASSLNTPNTLAGFSYLFWWASGLLVYFNERHNRYVRFHAVQSILLTGVLTVASVVLYILWELSGDLTAATHQPAFAHVGQGLAFLGYLAIIGLWLGAMIAAWSGHHLRLPIVGAYAERYAAPPREPFPPSPFSD